MRFAPALCLLFVFATGWAAKPNPPPPTHYVLDEPAVLNENARRAIESLLIEHDRLTGEQIIIAIFQSLDEEERVDFTTRVFSEWKIGQRGKDNGVLLALYWKERKARIEVGYGLEPLLTDARSKTVFSDFLIPELKNNDPARALSLSVLEILRVIESPLIPTGQAQKILRGGGFQGRMRPRPAPTALPGWIVWLVLGSVICFIVFEQLTNREAHFTSGGWYRPSPLRRTRWTQVFHNLTSSTFWGSGRGSGGGGWSSGGGGGGFLGGGGGSGGGGASGNW